MDHSSCVLQVQGTYGHFEWDDSVLWTDDEPKASRAVFIGPIGEVLEAHLRGLLNDNYSNDDGARAEVDQQAVNK